LNLRECKYYPGFLTHLGKVVTERAAQKRPLKFLELGNLDITEFYQAIDERVLHTSSEDEEMKESESLLPLSGFTLKLDSIRDSKCDALKYGILSDTQHIEIQNIQG